MATAKDKQSLLKEKMRLMKLRKSKKNVDENKEEEEEVVVVKFDFFATGSRDKLIKIWNASRDDSIMTLAGHDGEVNTLQFHFNGKFLLSGSDDFNVRIWDL